MVIAQLVRYIGFTLTALLPVLTLIFLIWRRRPKQVARRIIRQADKFRTRKKRIGERGKEVLVTRKEAELLGLEFLPAEEDKFGVPLSTLMEIAERS